LPDFSKVHCHLPAGSLAGFFLILPGVFANSPTAVGNLDPAKPRKIRQWFGEKPVGELEKSGNARRPAHWRAGSLGTNGWQFTFELQKQAEE